MNGRAEPPLLRIRELVFRYPRSGFTLELARFDLEAGTRLACVGRSGCGKTTWLNLISGLLQAHGGSLCFAGRELVTASDRERRALRVREIGMVFQEFELLEYLNVRDNILLPYRLDAGLQLDHASRRRAQVLAQELGIDHLLDEGPSRISQGEKQRVALCRALVTRPRLLLCDEATGNLDPQATRKSLEFLFRAVEREGASLIFVTHDRSLIGEFDAVLDLSAAGTRGERR